MSLGYCKCHHLCHSVTAIGTSYVRYISQIRNISYNDLDVFPILCTREASKAIYKVLRFSSTGLHSLVYRRLGRTENWNNVLGILISFFRTLYTLKDNPKPTRSWSRFCLDPLVFTNFKRLASCRIQSKETFDLFENITMSSTGAK